MIERINLLEQNRFRITHGTLLSAFVSVFTICLLIYASLALTEIQTTTHARLLTADIERLKKEREKLMQKGESPEITGRYKELKSFFLSTPPWSQILNSITLSLPPNVWLVSLKTSSKETSSSKIALNMNGLAKGPQGLSSFLADLEAVPYFDNVILISSKEEQGLFNFSISCDIRGVLLR